MSGDPGKPGQARDDRALEAAVDSVDTERLLAGEDPTSSLIDDVEHWIAVYQELLDFKRFMLDGAAARAGEMSQPDSRREVEETDLTVARAEAERFSRRLAYWRGRLESS